MQGVNYESAVKLIGANIAHSVFDDYLGGGSRHIREQGRVEADVLATIYAVDYKDAYAAINKVYYERFALLKEAHINRRAG